MAGDSFDEAQAALEQQRRDYLAAMAQAGSQGAQEFTNAQADLNGQKSAAVQQALAEAARRGAPAGMQQSIEYQTSLPYNNRVSDLTSSNASHTASFGANKSAGDTVIAQAIANIPALRAMSQRQAEAERFKAQMQQAQDALAMQLKQVDLQIAQQNLARSRSGGSGGDPLVDEGRQLSNEKLRRELFGSGGESGQSVLDDAQSHLGGPGSNGFRALNAIIANAGSLPEALSLLGGDAVVDKNGNTIATLKTPGGRPLDKNVLSYYLKRYEAAS